MTFDRKAHRAATAKMCEQIYADIDKDMYRLSKDELTLDSLSKSMYQVAAGVAAICASLHFESKQEEP